MFWMNEHQPTFLTAEPPAQRGEARFEVEFSIDENKRLTHHRPRHRKQAA